MNELLKVIDEAPFSDKAFALAVGQWLKRPDRKLAGKLTMVSSEWGYDTLAARLMISCPTHPDLPEVFRFFVELSNAAKSTGDKKHLPLKGFFTWCLQDNETGESPPGILQLIRENHKDLGGFMVSVLKGRDWYSGGFEPRENPTSENPFKKPTANFIWEEIDEKVAMLPSIFADEKDLFAMVVKFRPELTKIWVEHSGKLSSWDISSAWYPVIENTTDFDTECREFCAALKEKNPSSGFDTLHYLNEARQGKYLDETLEYARLPGAIQSSEAILMGLKYFPDELLPLFAEAISLPDGEQYVPSFDDDGYRQMFNFALGNWKSQGADFFMSFGRSLSDFRFPQIFDVGNIPFTPEAYPVLRKLMDERSKELKGVELAELWEFAVENHPLAFADDLVDLLSSGGKRLRSLAANALALIHGASFIPEATEILAHKKADVRLGAVEVLVLLGVGAVAPLKEAHAVEKSQKVQAAIEEALSKLGAESEAVIEVSVAQLLEQIEKDRRIKLPVAKWFDFSGFSLIQKEGDALPEKVTTFLIQKQSKHKAIEAAPGILPLLGLVDRKDNADAALSLVEQFLDSDQAAKDRWALTLGCLFGDNRIITLLTPRIQPWCENARHKLAEYAAQAIALLGTEEALMILDTLANRYRSKFKNIGKACREAFQKAAEIRGVTEDELGDLVVPNLGFNSEGQKEFDDGKIIAVLQPDFKISWLNPETEKETKSPPSTLSAEGKEELKVLRKLLREAVKSQTARLEQMLVRQRRWPVARWQELFEEHPLLQSYASSLVWGIYDADGTLMRTFRRYPNGILAHGSGEMEDLEERDTFIGLVHPLELDEEGLSVWRDHLGRFKVKPPFAQIDRPVELVEEGHGNRREIGITDKISMSYGTFNGRTNRLGWIRGSVVDAGGVSSYYKPFHGAGVEAILTLEECWVGMDPMDEVTMEKAFFAKIESVERGSYVYDDPQPDDPRVLSFGEVPPIVYSETIAELKAIIAGQS